MSVPRRAGAAPADGLRVFAPAKLNLHLAILAREASGYHQLETVFCALELADHVEVRRGRAGVRLEVRGAELGPPEENLVYRAALAFHRAAGLEPSIDLRLDKRIPAGAGLGGGSSDAAAALRALNALYRAPLDDATLLELAAALGSDVPFFLAGSPLALAWGRGERLLPLPPLPSAPVLLAVPGFPISTADAYRALDEARAAGPPAVVPRVLRAEAVRSWDAATAAAHNDFEAVIFRRFPELGRMREALAESGARFSMLAGTGSTLFAIYADESARAAGAEAVRRRFPDLTLFETATMGEEMASP